MSALRHAKEIVMKKLANRRLSLPFIGVMMGVHVGAVAACFYYTHQALLVCLVLGFLTNCIGVSLGMHRLFTHRSFCVPRLVRYMIGILSTLAFQGTIRQWVGHHRMHHAGADTVDDPHNAGNGFFYAHIGWLIAPYHWYVDRRKMAAFVRDIDADPVMRVMSTQWFMVMLQLGLSLGLYLWGGGALVLWGICLRLVICYHSTWLVNSAGHMFGYQNYIIADQARNNWWVALLSWGEGWHNNHHAYPQSAKTGHRWWELDVTYWIILLMKWVKLASAVKTVDSWSSSAVPPLTDLSLKDDLHKPGSLHHVG